MRSAVWCRGLPVLVALAMTLGLADRTAIAQGGAPSRTLPSRLEPGTRTAIQALADSLAATGLPAAAIYDKAAEGVLKGADDARILVVVRVLAQRLREARTLLGAGAGADDLTAGASALAAGLTSDQVQRVARARERRPTEVTLAAVLSVLSDLVAQRVPGALATSSVEMLLDRGARDVDLTSFRAGVMQDILAGQRPGEATSSRVQSALRALDARRPPDR